MKSLGLMVFLACLSSIPLADACAQPLFSHAESLECTVLNADTVLVGTLEEVGEGADTATMTLAVELTLKGEHHDRLPVRLPAPGPDLATVRNKARSARLLVAANTDPPVASRVIDLSDQKLEVLTADFSLLKEPEDVIRAAKRAIRRMPGVRRIETFSIVVPGRVAAGTHWEEYYLTGGYITLAVPVDDRLEERARASTRSESYREREEGAQALRYFRSDENVARLRTLLADPGWAYLWHAEENKGVEVRVYGVRAEAYQTLKYWGVQADEPMTRDQVMKLERVRTVDLSNSRVTDVDLKDLARFKNLENLYLRNVPVTDANLRRLAGLKGLLTLDLGGTGVTDAGLKELAGLTGLRDLSVRSTKVTDAGLKELAGLKSLVSLDLEGSEASAAGIAELIKLRPDLKVRR